MKQDEGTKGLPFLFKRMLKLHKKTFFYLITGWQDLQPLGRREVRRGQQPTLPAIREAEGLKIGLVIHLGPLGAWLPQGSDQPSRSLFSSIWVPGAMSCSSESSQLSFESRLGHREPEFDSHTL